MIPEDTIINTFRMMTDRLDDLEDLLEKHRKVDVQLYHTRHVGYASKDIFETPCNIVNAYVDKDDKIFTYNPCLEIEGGGCNYKIFDIGVCEIEDGMIEKLLFARDQKPEYWSPIHIFQDNRGGFLQHIVFMMENIWLGPDNLANYFEKIEFLFDKAGYAAFYQKEICNIVVYDNISVIHDLIRHTSCEPCGQEPKFMCQDELVELAISYSRQHPWLRPRIGNTWGKYQLCRKFFL